VTRLIISEEATQDLQDIGDYIALDNLDVAISFVERIERRCLEIAQHPGIGRKRNELKPGLKSCAEGKYLIFYKTASGITEIIRIVHGYRAIEKIFEEM